MGSPSKGAQQSASGTLAAITPIIQQLQQYTQQQEVAARGGIAGVGANPYFGTAQQMSPTNYAINPAQTQTFGTYGPGTYLASLMSQGRGTPTPATPTIGTPRTMNPGPPTIGNVNPILGQLPPGWEPPFKGGPGGGGGMQGHDVS